MFFTLISELYYFCRALRVYNLANVSNKRKAAVYITAKKTFSNLSHQHFSALWWETLSLCEKQICRVYSL